MEMIVSCQSQSYWSKVKYTQALPVFELSFPNPFPTRITIILLIPLLCRIVHKVKNKYRGLIMFFVTTKLIKNKNTFDTLQ